MLSAPSGFCFASTKAGFKYKDRDDLGLILSKVPAKAAGVFTRNKFQAAPITIARERLKLYKEQIRAILVNVGQANACTGSRGPEDCLDSLRMTAKVLGIDPEHILPASTGVIGQPLDLNLWRACLQDLNSNLGSKGALHVAQAMLTTDAYPKTCQRRVQLCAGEINVLGLAKGAGMICPDMATMLCFLLTDADVEAEQWQNVLNYAVDRSFNRITVDGDTSTNDCVLALANGASSIRVQGAEIKALQQAVLEVCQELAYLIVQDAEGGSKILRIQVLRAQDDQQAAMAARCIAHSPLVKCAFFGQDPNWGRILAALGRSGADFSGQQVSVLIQGRPVFLQGSPVQEDLDALVAQYMSRQEIQLIVDLGQGSAEYELLASDLSLEYVRINSAYRS